MAATPAAAWFGDVPIPPDYYVIPAQDAWPSYHYPCRSFGKSRISGTDTVDKERTIMGHWLIRHSPMSTCAVDIYTYVYTTILGRYMYGALLPVV